MKRVLCIVSSMDRGGAETFLMKIYRKLDKKNYQMDFCVTKKEPGYYDEEIKKMGGKIFVIPQKSKHPLKSFLKLKKIVKEEKYYSVLRTSQQSLATIDLIAAKFGGAKKLIYRSSNSNITGNKIKKIVNKFFSFLPKIIPNVKIAPSTEAATFVFGKKQVDSGKVQILKNCLDYDLFRFNIDIRNKILKELNLKNKIVFGHVGRFNIQKNHQFLLDVFKQIHNKLSNSVLLLIGEGELFEQVKNQVLNYGLNDCVLFLGSKPNVNEYLMAMDILIFPSFFEGMPNVLIEAQATGLKCVVSDSITKEANITGLVKYLDLQLPIEDWTNLILNELNYNRCDKEKLFNEQKYNLSNNINEYINLFF